MADFPIGSVIYYLGVGAPTGWLEVGQDVSRVTYAALFNVVGTTGGVGDGSTTFGLQSTKVIFPDADPSVGHAIVKY